MAKCLRFVCTGCGFSIEAWSDGNPFYVDGSGNKVNTYHPNHDEIEKYIANDVPRLCLQCGAESNIDSRLDPQVCPKCGWDNVVDTFALKSVKGPTCHGG